MLEVSTAGYYAWLDREPSPRARRQQRIQQAVQQVHADSHGIYGSYKVARQLAERPDLESACRNTVAKAMRELGLKSRIPRTFTPTTTQADPTQQPAPNHLAQDFTAAVPNRKWVTDITYLPTAAGWVYLAVVLDLFSRRVVGFGGRDRAIGKQAAAAIMGVPERRQCLVGRSQAQASSMADDRNCSPPPRNRKLLNDYCRNELPRCRGKAARL